MKGLHGLKLAPLGLVLLLAGCDAPQNMMSHLAGPAARRLAALGWVTFIIFLVTTAVVWGMMAWLLNRRRGNYREHAPVDSPGGQKWIWIGGVFAPVVVFSGLYLAAMIMMTLFPISHGHEAREPVSLPDIRVTGHQWWFDVEYLPGGGLCTTDTSELGRQQPTNAGLAQGASRIVRSPTEVHIPVGVPVEVELVTDDVIHSFWVPKLHGKVDLVPGFRNRIRLLAEEPGVYMGQCGEYCGVQHAHMRIMVVAHTPQDYVRWYAKQLGEAPPPSDSQLRTGRDLFMRSACAACHTVRGTPAHGSVGPDLTHVGSRLRLAGGMLDHTPGAMGGWITGAQTIKPGVEMPNFREFSGQELRALVAYLESLK